MVTAKPPFKLAIAAAFLTSETLNAGEVFAALQNEYEGEKLFTFSNIEAALQSLRGVGILRSFESASGDILYSLTNSGKERVRRSL